MWLPQVAIQVHILSKERVQGGREGFSLKGRSESAWPVPADCSLEEFHVGQKQLLSSVPAVSVIGWGWPGERVASAADPEGTAAGGKFAAGS